MSDRVLAQSPTLKALNPPRHLDLHALGSFVAICDAGTMTLAAQRLHLTQSAISQQMRALELRIGTRLFDRETRPLQLTDAGRLLRELAADLLSHERRVATSCAERARGDFPLLRLGCVDSFAATVGPALIRGLSGEAQQLRMWSGLTPQLIEQLGSRELDLAICTEAPVHERIKALPLFSEAMVAVFPRSRAAPAQTDKLSGLRAAIGSLPLVRYSDRSVIGRQIERYLRHHGLESPRRYEFDATEPLLSMVAAQLGWAVSTPLCLWQSRALLDEVHVVPLPRSPLGQREFHALTRAGEFEPASRELVRLTTQVLHHQIGPALARTLPGLPAGILRLARRAPRPL
jgi:DNA-binding transcriptional LysR family regulator